MYLKTSTDVKNLNFSGEKKGGGHEAVDYKMDLKSASEFYCILLVIMLHVIF